jgi:glycosyltransferase involved in cell wall biosynthesis
LKISIITITYNSEKTLEDTIKSVATQEYPNLEYLIIDGGSKDRTLDIVKQYEGVVTKWISEPDKGISDAFNKGIKMATGDIIGIINSDDMLAPNALNLVIESLKGDTDVLYGNAIMFGNGERYRYKSNSDLSGFYKGFPIVHPTVFIRKSAYNVHGLFDINYRCSMDYDLLLRMYSNSAKFQYLNKDLAFMRLGGENQKNYIKVTTKECKRISVKYGLSKFEASLIRIRSVIRFILVGFIRKTPFSKFIRKFIHSKQTELNV